MGTSQLHDQSLTHPAHESHVSSYIIIFVILMVLLAMTIGAAFVDFGHPIVNFAIASAIALTKGALIIMFFMHVKTGPRRVVIFAIGGFLWLALMAVLFLADYMTRNDPYFPNPKGEPVFVQYGDAPPRVGDPHARPTPDAGGHHGPAQPPKQPAPPHTTP